MICLTWEPETAIMDNATMADALLLLFKIIFHQILPSQSPIIKIQLN